MLILVVMAAFYAVWQGLDRTYAFTNEDIVAQTQARTALGEMIEFIRTGRLPPADCIPSDDLAAVIPKAYANELWIWTDTDRDIDHDLELVRFRVDVSSGTLYRDQAEEGQANFSGGISVRLVSRNVGNDASDSSRYLFRYYDASGMELPVGGDDLHVSDPTKIREVGINLRVDISPGKAPATHVLTSIVQPRNLRQY